MLTLNAIDLEVEMESNKLRGRPKGSVIPTDRKALEAVADLILREPTRRPTAAIKSIVTDWTDSVVHRLMGKWRKEKGALLDEAQRRKDAKGASDSAASSFAVGRAMLNLPAQMRGIYDSPAMKVFEQIHNSPTMRVFHEIQNNSVIGQLKVIQDNSAMRIFSAMRESPAVRMMREMPKIPVMKVLQERERL